MRYLRKQVINRRAPYDQRLEVDINNNVVMSTPAGLQLPAGPTSSQPIVSARYGTSNVGDLSGMIRYNTQTSQFEGNQAGEWRAFRFKESTGITQQNIGAGDGNEVYFGPLNPAPPTLVQSGTTWGAQNLLVIVENVIQVSGTNYEVELNPSFSSEVEAATTSVLASTGETLLYFNTALNCNGASGDTTTVTLTFDSSYVDQNGVTQTRNAAPFAVGSDIVVTGFTPVGYNGTYTVTACTTSSVSYTNATTGSATVVGNATSSVAYYPDVNFIGTVVTGSASIDTNTEIVSFSRDNNTDALVSVVINKALLGNISGNTSLTLSEPSLIGSGYYLKFSSPVPYGKIVTVLHGFDQ